MEAVVYYGELSKLDTSNLIDSLSNITLTSDLESREDFISNLEVLLKKRKPFIKRKLNLLYSKNGYKHVLKQSVYEFENKLKIDNNKIITSSKNGLLSHYDVNKNILSIYEAAESDWPSPTSFNFLILNPMMLDFERLIFHNTQNQKIALIQDGEDALFIEGCGGGEKIRIVMNKSFPCIDNSMYYKKSYNASIFRKIFYRFYQSIGNVISDFEYPSIVVIIDTIENKDLFKGSSKN